MRTDACPCDWTSDGLLRVRMNLRDETLVILYGSDGGNDE